MCSTVGHPYCFPIYYSNDAYIYEVVRYVANNVSQEYIRGYYRNGAQM